MKLTRAKNCAGHISGKLLFTLAVAVCLILGIAGLVLPVIPGLLFLAIAALLLGPHVPAIGNWLHRNPTMHGYVEDAEQLRNLKFRDQLRYGVLLSIKMTLDGAKLVLRLVGRVFERLGRQHLKRGRSRRAHYNRAYQARPY